MAALNNIMNCLSQMIGRSKIFYVITETMEKELPTSVNSALEYAASPGVIIPIFLLLAMTIYYLVSVGRSLRDANTELRMQLEYERTEGRRKVYAMADAKRELEASKNKVLPEVPPKPRRNLSQAATSVMAVARMAKMLSGDMNTSTMGKAKIPVAVVTGKRSLKGNSPVYRDPESAYNQEGKLNLYKAANKMTKRVQGKPKQNGLLGSVSAETFSNVRRSMGSTKVTDEQPASNRSFTSYRHVGSVNNVEVVPPHAIDRVPVRRGDKAENRKLRAAGRPRHVVLERDESVLAARHAAAVNERKKMAAAAAAAVPAVPAVAAPARECEEIRDSREVVERPRHAEVSSEDVGSAPRAVKEFEDLTSQAEVLSVPVKTSRPRVPPKTFPKKIHLNRRQLVRPEQTAAAITTTTTTAASAAAVEKPPTSVEIVNEITSSSRDDVTEPESSRAVVRNAIPKIRVVDYSDDNHSEGSEKETEFNGVDSDVAEPPTDSSHLRAPRYPPPPQQLHEDELEEDEEEAEDDVNQEEQTTLESDDIHVANRHRRVVYNGEADVESETSDDISPRRNRRANYFTSAKAVFESQFK